MQSLLSNKDIASAVLIGVKPKKVMREKKTFPGHNCSQNKGPNKSLFQKKTGGYIV